MYHALLPIDNDEDRVMAQARAAADLSRAGEAVEVTFLHVFDDQKRADDTSATRLSAGNKAADYLRDCGITTHSESRAGDPSEMIVRVADEINADSIILGGRKRSSLGALIFGSVSQTVMLDAEYPVMITGDTVKADPDSICRTCGKKYYTEIEITECRSCGGAKVERV